MWVLAAAAAAAAAAAGLYMVEPASGVIPGGSSTQILLRFSPREVEDVGRIIRADFVGLDAEQKPLQIDVDGKVGAGQMPVQHQHTNSQLLQHVHSCRL
jgi:hypothetical protein